MTQKEIRNTTPKDLQDEKDSQAVTAIEARAMNRQAEGQGVNAEAEKAMLGADLENFKAIKSPAWQESAAVEIANNGRQYPEYKAALSASEPAIVEKIAALDAASSAKVQTKEDRKAAEFADTLKATGAQLGEAPTLNVIEPNIERKQQALSAEEDAKRSAWVKKADPAQPTNTAAAPSNKVESDEVFTATNAGKPRPHVPPEVEKQFVRVGDKFYHRKKPDELVFEDKGNKLETKSSGEGVAESLVRIAEARGWDEIKVSGSESFRKTVWLEAAARGMTVKGYSPSEADKQALDKRNPPTANKIEKVDFRAREKSQEDPKEKPQTAKAPESESHSQRLAKVFSTSTSVEAVAKHPELAGAVAAITAVTKKIEADGLTPHQRAVVSAHVRQKTIESIEANQIPDIKIRQAADAQQSKKEEKDFSR